MEVQRKTISKTKEGAEITATAEEVKPHFDKAYEEFRSQAEIKGFRKGKAPLSIIKKMYGDVIEREAIQDIVNILYRQAVDQYGLKPISEPVLKKVDYNPGETFTFSVEYEIIPEFELQDYKNIEVEKPIQRVTDPMIEREIKSIQLNFAERSETDTVTDIYHVLTVDIQELDEQGVAIIGRRTQDQTINLFDERYEKEFIRPLLNAKKGGEYVVRYEHDHGDHHHRVHVKVSVKKIEKINLPEITDPFVQEKFKGKFESAEALRNDIRKQIQQYFDQESTRLVRNKIADEIVKRHDFPVPEALISKVFDQMIEDLKERMPEKKLPPDFDRHAFEAEYYTHAEWQARWSVIREKLFEAEKEHIEVTETDLEKRAERDAEQFGIMKESLLSIYKSNNLFHDRILHDKLMEQLESYATITEKEVTPPEEEPERQQSRIIT